MTTSVCKCDEKCWNISEREKRGALARTNEYKMECFVCLRFGFYWFCTEYHFFVCIGLRHICSRQPHCIKLINNSLETMNWEKKRSIRDTVKSNQNFCCFLSLTLCLVDLVALVLFCSSYIIMMRKLCTSCVDSQNDLLKVDTNTNRCA